jgi:hypothetical protein
MELMQIPASSQPIWIGSFSTQAAAQLHIGFGLPAPSGIVMYGQLSTDGRLNRFQIFGDKPLFGMVFVIPKTMVEVTIWDPQRVEHYISIIEDWVPQRLNAIDGFYFDGSVIRPDKGDNWNSGP